MPLEYSEMKDRHLPLGSVRLSLLFLDQPDLCAQLHEAALDVADSMPDGACAVPTMAHPISCACLVEGCTPPYRAVPLP